MTKTQFLTRFTGVYLLLTLPIALLLDMLTTWLTIVVLFSAALALIALLEREHSTHRDELYELIRTLRLEQRTWKHLEEQWLGRTVRLTEDIRNHREPDGLQLYVQAGTPGTIVALNRDEYAPFTVKFPGFGFPVKADLDSLDVLLDETRSGNVPPKPRPYGLLSHVLLEHRAYDDEDEEDDDDDVPEAAEAFVHEMRHFAALDWHVWNDPFARRAYRQMKHQEN